MGAKTTSWSSTPSLMRKFSLLCFCYINIESLVWFGLVLVCQMLFGKDVNLELNLEESVWRRG
jgi:hypothetical protein